MTYRNERSEFGRQIDIRLAELGMTYAELASRLGVSGSAVRRYRLSENPRRETVRKVATALGVSSERLNV